MSHPRAPSPRRIDRLAIMLSGACAVHCLATLILVALLGLGGSVLLNPAIHRVGLAAAVMLGVVAIGFGFARHRRPQPLIVGAAGLGLMASALATGHGPLEALLDTFGGGG